MSSRLCCAWRVCYRRNRSCQNESRLDCWSCRPLKKRLVFWIVLFRIMTHWVVERVEGTHRYVHSCFVNSEYRIRIQSQNTSEGDLWRSDVRSFGNDGLGCLLLWIPQLLRPFWVSKSLEQIYNARILPTPVATHHSPDRSPVWRSRKALAQCPDHGFGTWWTRCYRCSQMGSIRILNLCFKLKSKGSKIPWVIPGSAKTSFGVIWAFFASSDSVVIPCSVLGGGRGIWKYRKVQQKE